MAMYECRCGHFKSELHNKLNEAAKARAGNVWPRALQLIQVLTLDRRRSVSGKRDWGSRLRPVD